MSEDLHAELDGKFSRNNENGMWDDSGEEPKLIVAFDTDEPEFARGWQMGMLYMLLYSGVAEIEVPLYITNAEMVIRIAEALGYNFEARYEDPALDADDHDWMIVKFFDQDAKEENGTSEG